MTPQEVAEAVRAKFPDAVVTVAGSEVVVDLRDGTRAVVITDLALAPGQGVTALLGEGARARVSVPALDLPPAESFKWLDRLYARSPDPVEHDWPPVAPRSPRAAHESPEQFTRRRSRERTHDNVRRRPPRRV